MSRHEALRVKAFATVGAGMLCALLSLAASAAAEAPEYLRGNIVSVDWGSYTMQLKDPKGRVVTWKVSRNATVKFTDGAGVFRNPKVQDLRPPMYIHFMAESQVIQEIDVRELGFVPGADDTQTNSSRQPGVSRTLNAVVTASDPGRGHIEVEHDGIRETLSVANKGLLDGVGAGQRVTLVTDWVGQNELVAQLKILGGGSRPGSPSGATTATGRVVRVSLPTVVINVGGRDQSYGVSDPRVLKDVRAGDRIRFTYERRGGSSVITAIE